MGIFRGRPSRLLAAWAGYWVLLAGAALWKPLALIASWWGLPAGAGTATVSGGYKEGRLGAEILRNSETVWSGSVSLTLFAIAVAAPPLLMLWSYLREAPASRAPAALGEGTIPMEPMEQGAKANVRQE